MGGAFVAHAHCLCHCCSRSVCVCVWAVSQDTLTKKNKPCTHIIFILCTIYYIPLTHVSKLLLTVLYLLHMVDQTLTSCRVWSLIIDTLNFGTIWAVFNQLLTFGLDLNHVLALTHTNITPKWNAIDFRHFLFL